MPEGVCEGEEVCVGGDECEGRDDECEGECVGGRMSARGEGLQPALSPSFVGASSDDTVYPGFITGQLHHGASIGAGLWIFPLKHGPFTRK